MKLSLRLNRYTPSYWRFILLYYILKCSLYEVSDLKTLSYNNIINKSEINSLDYAIK